MFFILSKLLAFFINPLIWILILLILAIFIHKSNIRKKLLLAALIFFLFFSNNFITDEFVRRWEYPLINENELDSSYEIGLLLGGGMVNLEKETNRLILRNNPDRLFQTIRLYQVKRVKKIFISSGSGSLINRDMLEANLVKRYLLEIGIPDSAISVDSLSDNTRENALFTSKIIHSSGLKKKILLITSAIHMRRAGACFRKAGVQFTPYAVDKYVGKRRYDPAYLLVPDVDCFVKWDKLLHEYVGYITYSMMGYL